MIENTEHTTIVGKDFPAIAIEQIRKAQNSIKIIVYDWRWYPTQTGSPTQQFNNEIVMANKKGIEVKAITNIKDVVNTLKGAGIRAKQLETSRLVHVKLMIIDDKHIIIGSHNYTQNAFNLNYELSVLIKNYPDIERVLTFFNNLF